MSSDPIIKTCGLTKHFRAGGTTVSAVRNVDVEIAAGEFAAVVGPSGSGKSTLMNLLGLLDEPSSGSYRLAGEETARLYPASRADLRSRKLGFVFQNYSLLGRNTALENVALPLAYARHPRRMRRERAAEMLAIVGLEDRMHHWPSQLSGGEQQRVAIARALVNDPAIILADEPTGALDTRTSEDILTLFAELNRTGRTIVVVTHDMDVACRTQRIIRMQDGLVVQNKPSSPPVRLHVIRRAAEQSL